MDADRVELNLIGSKSTATSWDNTAKTLTFKGYKGPEVYSEKLFNELEVKAPDGSKFKTPQGACMGVWLSKSNCAHHFCRNKGKKGHGSLHGGAHGPVPGWWRAVALTLCLAVPAGGTFVPTASTFARKTVPSLPRLGAAPAHAFLPLSLQTEGFFVGLPNLPSEGVVDLFGSERDFVEREADYAQAKRWSSTLFAVADRAHSFYLFELEDPPLVVSGVVVGSSTPEDKERTDRNEAAETPEGGALVDRYSPTSTQVRQEAAGLPGTDIAWVPLTDLHGSSLGARVARIGAARADSFRMPTIALDPIARTGTMPERALDARQVLFSAQLNRLDRDTVLERAERAQAELRRECERRIDEEGVHSARGAGLEKWLAACRPLETRDIDPALWHYCYEPVDARLASVPFPRIPSVHTAPLPPKGGAPPYHRVPKWATDWGKHCFLPIAARELLRCQRAHRAHWRYVAKHGTAAGAPPVDFFACGPDSCQNWARKLIAEGEVIVKRHGKLTLLDQSQTPKFTLSPGYAAEMLKDSPDAALRDATTVIGIDFLSNVARQLVIFKPMRTIEDGVVSIHESLETMIESVWFASEKASGLDNGEICLATMPGRFPAVGCVPRDYSKVMRMIVNNSGGDERDLTTTVGVKAPVISLNKGVDSARDKAIRRAERDTLPQLKRAARPTAISAQAIAERAPYSPPAILPGSEHPDAATLPPELKPFFYMLMVTLCILGHAGWLLDMPVYVVGDDYSKYFHLFTLATRQLWTCQLITLDPSDVTRAAREDTFDKILAGMDAAELAITQELCMSMGTTPSSNYAQRYATEFCNRLNLLFHEQHAAYYEELAAKHPSFASWQALRKTIALETGLPEDMLAYVLMFTDDPVGGAVGVRCACDLAELIDVESAAANLKRGDPVKRSFGVQVKWTGAYAFTTGLLAFMPPDKMQRAEQGLQRALQGDLAVKPILELLGLLHHVVFTLAVPMHVMYNCYDGLDLLRRKLRSRNEATTARRALFLCGGPPGSMDDPDALSAIATRYGFEVDNLDILTGCDLLAAGVEEKILREMHERKWFYVHGANTCRSYSIEHEPVLRWRDEPHRPVPREWRRYLAKETHLAHMVTRLLTAADDLDLLWSHEHPGPRWDTQAMGYWEEFAHVGTIYDDALFQRLSGRPSADSFDMYQCQVGSEFQKFTRFTIRRELGARLKPRLAAGVPCTCGRHKKVARGRNAAGESISKGAAHYTPEMKCGLCSSAMETADELGWVGKRHTTLEDDTMVPVTPRSRKAFENWITALSQRSGTSMLAAVFHGAAPHAARRTQFHSDAALRGTAFPAIAGNLYGEYYIIPLKGTGLMRWPIVALEFAGEGPLNLLILGHLVPPEGPIILPCDSFVAPLVMAGRARDSKFMCYLHEQFMALEVVQRLYHRLYASQEFGVGNPITDRLSRGTEIEALEIMQHLRHRPHKHAATRAAIEYLENADAYFSSLTAEQMAIEQAVLAELARERAAARAARDLRRARGRRPARRTGNPTRLAAIAAVLSAATATALPQTGAAGQVQAKRCAAPFSSSKMGDGPRRSEILGARALAVAGSSQQAVGDQWTWCCHPPLTPESATSATCPDMPDDVEDVASDLELELACGESDNEEGEHETSGNADEADDVDDEPLDDGEPDEGSVPAAATQPPGDSSDEELAQHQVWHRNVRLRGGGDAPPASEAEHELAALVADDQHALHHTAASHSAIDEYEAYEEYLYVEWWSVDTGEGLLEQAMEDMEDSHGWAGGSASDAELGPSLAEMAEVWSIADREIQAIIDADLHWGHGPMTADGQPIWYDGPGDGHWSDPGSPGASTLHYASEESTSAVEDAEEDALNEGDAEPRRRLFLRGGGEAPRLTAPVLGLPRHASRPPRLSGLSRDALSRSGTAWEARVISSLGLPAGTPPRPQRLTGSAAPLRIRRPALVAPALATPRPFALTPPPMARVATPRVDGWEAALLQDPSAFALLPGEPEKLEGLLDDMRDTLARAFASSTNRTDVYHLRAWERACRQLGTPMWRTDVAANSGIDPIGHRRELILPALALIIMYADMSPRSKDHVMANPRSALSKLYAVAREHKKRGFRMAPFSLAIQVVKGMLQRHVEEHDILPPERKNPLNEEQIAGMLATPNGTSEASIRESGTRRRGDLVVDYAEYMWIAARATFATLAETGMRKGDVSKATKSTAFKRGRLTFGRLTWEINGTRMAAPTLDDFKGMTHGGCWLTYGALKNDAFGEFFGSKPSWLVYHPEDPSSACACLRRLEMAAAHAGLTPQERATVPLFGPQMGVEWHHGLIERIFVFLLRTGGGVSAADIRAYSCHSFRIYLACALYAANCPNDRIMAILRWKSEEALLIYARMNDTERTDWIEKAKRQKVGSTVAAHLPHVPRIDPDEWVRHMQASIASGDLGKAARDQDRDLEQGLEAPSA